jgi:hypothetical protein
VRCGLCENYQATVECEQCQGPLCDNCSTYIHSKGMYRQHRVTPVGQGAASRPPQRVCSEHGKELDLYCTVDDEIVCSHCLLVGAHKAHSCVALRDASGKARKAIESSTTELSTTRESVTAARETLVALIPRVHTEYDSALSGVVNAFQRVRRAIDERETHVRNQLYHVREVKVHLLARQIDALDETLHAADEASRAGERLLQRGDDYEIVQVRPACASRMTTLARAKHELEPRADSTFLYTFQDETEEAAKAYGYVDVSVLDEDIDPAVLRRIQTDLKQRDHPDGEDAASPAAAAGQAAGQAAAGAAAPAAGGAGAGAAPAAATTNAAAGSTASATQQPRVVVPGSRFPGSTPAGGGNYYYG